MSDTPPHVTFQPPGGERPPDGTGWLYLGWDVAGRERQERLWGSAPRPLGPSLREAAARLRGPFLDLVAGWGRGRADEAGWWAGTLAWKSWSASDLFLLCCFLAVADRLPRTSPLVVVVEDPWLQAQLGVPAPLLGRRLSALVLGLARRARWAFRMATSWVRTDATFAGRLPPDGGPAVLVHSYLLDRCLAPGRWEDPYFPGLEAELAAAGAAVVRCTDPDVAGFEERLGGRDGVVPLIRHVSFGGFLRALFALPPEVPGPARLDGLRIDFLVAREWWHDLSRAGRCAHLLLHDAAGRLLDSRPWKSLLLAWEGQPPERLLALAARSRGVRVVGSQHTTVSPFQLPFLLGAGEADWSPFPDVVLTTGPRPRRVLAEGGVPEARLRGGGSRRFGSPGPAAAAPGVELLVVLPVDPLRARHLLAALARAYPGGVPGVPVAVKPHPGDPRAHEALPFPFRIASEPLAESFTRARVVLFTSTAAGLEALAAGRAALRYRPDALLDVDPCDVLDDAALPTAGDGDLKRELDGMLADPRRPPDDAVAAAYAELFEPLDAEVWRRELLGA